MIRYIFFNWDKSLTTSANAADKSLSILLVAPKYYNFLSLWKSTTQS